MVGEITMLLAIASLHKQKELIVYGRTGNKVEASTMSQCHLTIHCNFTCE